MSAEEYHCGSFANFPEREIPPPEWRTKNEMAKREYKTADESLTVYWNSDLCHHCGNCFIKLPDVFQPDQRPWIKIDAAPSEKIRDVVKQCPSGAIALEPN